MNIGDWFAATIYNVGPGAAIDRHAIDGTWIETVDLDVLLGYHIRIDGLHVDADAQMWVLFTRASTSRQFVAHLDDVLALVDVSPVLPFVVVGVDYLWRAIGGDKTGRLVLVAIRSDDSTGVNIDFTLLIIDKATWATTEINGLDNHFVGTGGSIRSWVAFDCNNNKVYYSEIGAPGNINRIYAYDLTARANEALYYEEASQYTYPATIVCSGLDQLIVAFPDFGPGQGTAHGPYEAMALASSTVLWAGEQQAKAGHMYYRQYNALTGEIGVEVELHSSPGNTQRPLAMTAYFDACAASRRRHLAQATLIGAT